MLLACGTVLAIITSLSVNSQSAIQDLYNALKKVSRANYRWVCTSVFMNVCMCVYMYGFQDFIRNSKGGGGESGPKKIRGWRGGEDGNHVNGKGIKLLLLVKICV